MQYILVQNQQQIFLGPIDWKQRFIQSEFDDMYDQGEISFKYIVPPIEQGYINVGEGFEIFPIIDASLPDCDPLYEDLIGPFYTYANNEATATYDKQDRPLHFIQNSLKDISAAKRYLDENTTITVNTSAGSINVSSDRTSRLQYMNLLHSMGSDMINFKTNSGFVSLSNADIQLIIDSIHNYVQEKYNWEMDITNQIDNCSNISDLQNIHSSSLTPSNTGLPNA